LLVLEVNAAVVERGDDQFWRILDAKFDVFDVKSATVERGVDQF
jgi:hypothetical protein